MPPRKQQNKKVFSNGQLLQPHKFVTLKFAIESNIRKFEAIMQGTHNTSPSLGSSPALKSDISAEGVDSITPVSGVTTPLKTADDGIVKKGGFRGIPKGGKRSILGSPAPNSTTGGVETPSNDNDGSSNKNKLEAGAGGNSLRLQNNINPKSLPMNSNTGGAALLDKTGKRVRKWEKKPRVVKSFTGYKMQFSLWIGDKDSGLTNKMKATEKENEKQEQDNSDPTNPVMEEHGDHNLEGKVNEGAEKLTKEKKSTAEEEAAIANSVHSAPLLAS